MKSPAPRFGHLARLLASSAALWLTGAALAPAASQTLAEWAASRGYSGSQAIATADPDGNGVTNFGEYAFGLDPAAPGSPLPVVTPPQEGSEYIIVTFGKGAAAAGSVSYTIQESTNLITWTDLDVAQVEGAPNDYYTPVTALVARDGRPSLYVRVFAMMSEPAVAGPVPPVAPLTTASPPIQVGTNAYIQSINGDPSGNGADSTRYPQAAGTDRIAVTDYATSPMNSGPVRRRSWLGGFLWGDGVPPASDQAANWDYNWWSAAVNEWVSRRLDQQPIYADPLLINYNWPPGQFGFSSTPGQFGVPTGFPANHTIVRGVNLGQQFPYMKQAVAFNPNLPSAWQLSPLQTMTRPTETIVLVPSNLSPTQLVSNTTGDNQTNGGDAYPWPVWSGTQPITQQIPWNIMVDRMGDFDADIVYEATNPTDPDYETHRYSRASATAPYTGNFLKMTVAQGSPFVFCAQNNFEYANFYNLIRPNDLSGNTAQTASDPRVLGPYAVSGASGVSYVLLTADQINPDQSYPGQGPDASDNAHSLNPIGQQHNYAYYAVYYVTSEVQTVGAGNSGTDSQGNPYFYLQFNTGNQTNYYAVATIPTFRYYDADATSGNVTGNTAIAARDAAAQTYADALGGYAFNFISDTSIQKRVLNSNQVLTFFEVETTVPPISGNVVSAANTTVLALKPHHYQPIALGPDGNQTITWKTLLPTAYTPPGAGGAMTNYTDFNPVTDTSGLAGANQGFWGYWTVVGNLKTIAGSSFGTQYLFNNFLPALPPPNWDEDYSLTGLQGISVSTGGTGFQAAVNPQITIAPPVGGGATAVANAQTSLISGAVSSIGLTNIGSGYVNAGAIAIAFAPPPVANVSANAQAGNYSVTNGTITNITVSQGGSGYTTAPDIVIFDPSGQGFGAEATAVLTGDAVTSINITANGTGYPPTGVTIAIGPSPGNNTFWRVAKGYGNFYADGVGSITITDQGAGYGPTVEIIPAMGDPGTGAVGQVNIGGDSVATVSIISGGANYIQAPTLVIHGTGSGATAAAQVAGTVAGFAAGTGSGSGYYDTPTLTIAPPGGNGTQATGNFTTTTLGSLLGISLNNTGSGYNMTPTVNITGGNGTNAAAVANLAGDGISQVNMVNGGSGYSATPTITFSGGGTPTTTASGVANLQGGRIVSIFLTNGGAGYSSPPTLTIAPPGGNGTTATAYAVMSPGAVTNISISPAGSNYTAAAQIVVGAPSSGSGSTAIVNPVVTNGTITGVQIINGGSGYIAAPPVTISDTHGTGANATATIANNYIGSITLQNPGGNFTAVPTISFTVGSGATANATLTGNSVTNITITNGGSNYTSIPAVFIAPPTGPGEQATATASISGGAVTNITIVENGAGYTTTPSVLIAGGGSGAAATTSLSYGLTLNLTSAGTGYSTTPSYTINGGTEPNLPSATVTAGFGQVTSVIVTNVGTSSYNSPPTVTFSGGGPGGNDPATPAVATAVMSSSPVGNVTINSGGTGYPGNTTLSFSAPQIGNTSAAATVTVSGGVITGVSVTNAGSGYTTAPAITINGDGGSGGNLTATLTNNTLAYLDVTNPGTGYITPPTISFSGGGGAGAAATAQIGGITSINITSTGNGTFVVPPTVTFNSPSQAATLQAVVQNVTVANITTNGVITGVQVVHPGFGYSATPVISVAGGSGTGLTSANFTVTLNDTGGVGSVEVVGGQAGSGYQTVAPSLSATQVTGGGSALYSAPTGIALLDSSGQISSVLVTSGGGGYSAENPATVYIGGPLNLPAPSAPTGPNGFAAQLEIVGGSEQIGEILYDAMGTLFKTLAVSANQPWGGYFGESSPDTYGVGGKLSATAQGLTILYHLQRYQLESSGLDVPPADWPVKIYNTGVSAPFTNDAPNLTLKGALQTWVTELQNTLNVFFQGGGNTSVFTNNPPTGPGVTGQWEMQYFSSWDADAHRMVLYPTGSNPIPFVGSANNSAANYTPTGTNPQPVPANLPPGNVWEPGKMFNGFGFADQFNDHHYFYGYYLATAGMAAIFDQSWEPTPSAGNATWGRASGLGGAIDQFVMTLAYDPDTAGFNQFSQMQYPKFAFFDQWNGHAWASGLTPGPGGGGSGANATAVLTGNSVSSITLGSGGTQYLSPPQVIIAPPPGGGAQATAYATVTTSGAVTNITVLNGGSGYVTPPPVVLLGGGGSGMQALGLNENSNYEGIQSWAGTILWAAGTQRRSVFDLGLYLYATNTFAGDFYLFDKNYNQVDPTVLDANSQPYNQFSFVPRITGTTGDAGNVYPAQSTYWSAAQYNFTGSAAVNGQPIGSGGAIEYQGSNAVTTFFGPYPMSSRLIQALPPAPWTLAMGRNPEYMLGWGLPMFTEKWASMNGTVLMPGGYQASLDQSVAIGGLPHSTGQVPTGGNVTAATVATLPTSIDTYISNWVVNQQGATAEPIGTGATLQPNQDVSTVLNWFHIIDYYGTPDWTVYAVPTSANRMVFTAAFTKGGNTTLIGFNPGFANVTVDFHRLQPASGGSTIESGDPQVGTTMTIPPKQMVIETVSLPPPPP